MSKEMTPKEALKWLFLKASKQHYQVMGNKTNKALWSKKKVS